MGKLVAIAVSVLVLIVIGGGAILMIWDIPAPTTHVERTIPDARFPR